MHDGPLYNCNNENCDLCDSSITCNYCFERILKRKQHRRNEHNQEIILTLKQKREHIWVLLKQVTEKQLPSLYLQWQQPWQQRARADEVTWLLRRETNNISEAGFFAKLRPVVLYFIPPFPFSLFIYLLTLKYFTRYSFSRYAVTLKSVTRFSNTPHISSLSLLRPTLQATMFAVVSQ